MNANSNKHFYNGCANFVITAEPVRNHADAARRRQRLERERDRRRPLPKKSFR